jgi:hypothetical protein
VIKEMQTVESVEESLPMTPKCEIVHHTVVRHPRPFVNPPGSRFAVVAKPERQKEVDFHLPSVTGNFYDTGLLKILIYDADKRSRVLQLTNTRPLYTSGHLQKFLEIVQEITDSCKIDFANFRNSTLEYNDHTHGESFRAVIDDPDLPTVKKFAAILSTLIVAPTLKSEHILEIARLQKNPVTKDGEIQFGELRYFIFPHFNPEVEMRPRGFINRFQLTSENISGLLRIIGLLRCGDESKTFREFSESVGEEFIPTAMGCSRDDAEKAMEIYEEWGSAALKDLNIPLMKRISRIRTHNASASLKALLLKRVVAGDTMVIEDHQAITSHLASFLTPDEFEDFFSQLSQSPLSDKLPEEMGPLALEVIVFYYLQSGFLKVLELLEIVRQAPAYNSSFFYAKTVYEIHSPVRQKLKAPHFMLLLNDDYKDMPLGWAIPLVVAELEAEKQEHAKKIDELVASGVLPIAA